MRKFDLCAASAALFVAFATGSLVRSVLAEETASQPQMTPQKAISSPFLEGLVGSWTTSSTGTREGKEVKGAGKVKFEMGVGGTALLKTYERTGPGPDGKPVTFHGHGVFKVADDGKTLTGWWFSNTSPDASKTTGTLSETGFQLSGREPNGTPVSITFDKAGDGLTFEISRGPDRMTETYKRAP